jgi:hypothetical protein
MSSFGALALGSGPNGTNGIGIVRGMRIAGSGKLPIGRNARNCMSCLHKLVLDQGYKTR